MISESLPIRGATILRAERSVDERGSFRRVVDLDELATLGLETAIAQVSSVTNTTRGTLRGLHFQADPHAEAKTLWCTSGAVYDVLVDLREDEPTYGRWVSVVLSSDEPTALHVPRGIAHGYQTLEDDTALTYLISTPFVTESARSLLWNDATLSIEWPLPVAVISQRDLEAMPWPPRL